MNPLAIVRVVAALMLAGPGMMLVAVPNNTTASPAAIVDTTPAPTQLSQEEALDIALNHAGLTQEEILDLRARQETDDSIPHWDIEFRCDTYEHEYEIHAVTGAILDTDRERLRPKSQPQTPPAEVPPVTEPVTTPPATTEPVTGSLTREDAIGIALDHAGLTRADVTRLEAEKDRDDGVWVYEIEFHAGQMEYEYEIHAETGKILQWQKELDD